MASFDEKRLFKRAFLVCSEFGVDLGLACSKLLAVGIREQSWNVGVDKPKGMGTRPGAGDCSIVELGTPVPVPMLGVWFLGFWVEFSMLVVLLKSRRVRWFGEFHAFFVVVSGMFVPLLKLFWFTGGDDLTFNELLVLAVVFGGDLVVFVGKEINLD